MSTCRCWNHFHTVCQNFSTHPETPRMRQKVWQIHQTNIEHMCKGDATAQTDAHKRRRQQSPPTHTSPHRHTHAQTSRHTESTNRSHIRMHTHAIVNTHVGTYAQLGHIWQSAHTCAVTENMLGVLSSSDG